MGDLGCPCPLCRAGGSTIHTRAHALLEEALRVVAMHKSERDAYLVTAKARRPEPEVRDLLSVINTVRAHGRRSD